MSFSTYYDSGDTGLGGVINSAGSLISFLDKVLVNGYNAQTLTSMTCSGNIVTATLNAHGFRDRQFVTISGASPSGYNGTWQIIPGSASANTFQFQISSSGLSNATGTLACIVASLGWTKPFSGTNLAAYKQPSGNLLYCRIDDTGTTTAKMTGYETMTDVNTGTNLFPTALQLSGGIFVSKASAAVTRRAILWGNQSVFYFFVDYTGDSSAGCLAYYGDGISYKTGDAWFTMLAGSNTAGTFEGCCEAVPSASSTPYIALNTHYIARSYTQVAGAVTAGKNTDYRFGVFATGAVPFGGANSGAFAYPSPVDGNLWNAQITVTEIAAATPRGILTGIWAPLHNRPLTNYTIIQGAGNLAGKELMAINMGTTGQILAEVSNTF